MLAVCDANGTIMWSWHIWVTDHDMNNTIEVQNNPSVGGSVISHFMEVPLGYCDNEVRVRDKRTFNLKVKQTDDAGKTATISFVQLSEDSLYTYGNNAPYYQWGRKDPMLPSDGTTDNVDKPFYDNSKDWQRLSGYVSTETAIQNPFTFYYRKENDWSSGHKYDYWNINFTSAANINNTSTIKTIYDPSVSGFCLPRTAAFTNFTTTGTYTTKSNELNVSGSYNEGWNFFTGVNGNTIYFMSLAYRYPNGDIVGDEGLYWTSGASSTSRGRDMGFHYLGIDPQGTYYRSTAGSVRSVKE